ncbi:MAG: helix-turn-helix domain-containing protein [bacterium]|nr:helix-turn-helix domain-containing protein [bacterium]
MRLSQQEVASCMGTSQAVIARFESGKNKNPGIQFIFGLVRTLGMRLDFRIVLKNGRKVLS